MHAGAVRHRFLARSSTLSAAFVLALAASVSGLSGHAAAVPASPTPPGFSASAADAAVAALGARGIGRAEAVRILTRQRTEIALGERLTRELGSRAAGAYLEPRTGTVVVNVLSQAAADRVRAAGARARLVRHSSAQLTSTMTQLNRTLRVPGTAWAIDPASNQVVVTVSDAAGGARLAQVRAALARFGTAVRTQHTPGTLRPLIAGGDQIVADAGWICSAGFNATRGGQNYIVDAGHCTQGLPNWNGIGPSQDSHFPTDDYGLIRNTGQTPVPAVNLYNGSTQPISSASGGSVGETVCRSGRTTHVHCGTVTGLNATVNYGNGEIVYGLIQTNVCAEPGDSGGPLFDGSTGLGMTSGGSGNCSRGGQTFFQPLPEALSAYGLALLGGGGPPPPGGSGPITGIANKCVDIRYSNTANGTPIQLWDCNGTGAQRWSRQGNTLRALGKCMDVTSGGTANGTKVQLWDCNGTGAQLWQPQANGTLRNPQSGKCLDDPGSNTANGTQLIIWSCHGAANQVWHLP